MLRLFTNARITWVKDLKTETKIGADQKPYLSKSILFGIASNRDYTVNKVVNGVVVKERPSDFITCRATGSVAQAIADYASAKDPVTQKIISRHVSVYGSLETYTKKERLIVKANINGMMYDVPFEHEVERVTFAVRELEFLDSSAKSTAYNTTIVAGEAQIAGYDYSQYQVQGQGVIQGAVQTQPYATPVQQPVVQGAVQAQPFVAPVQQVPVQQVPVQQSVVQNVTPAQQVAGVQTIAQTPVQATAPVQQATTPVQQAAAPVQTSTPVQQATAPAQQTAQQPAPAQNNTVVPAPLVTQPVETESTDNEETTATTVTGGEASAVSIPEISPAPANGNTGNKCPW